MTSHRSWSDAIASGVSAVPDADLVEVARVLLAADLVITAGNGGSSAIASHFAQAISKPAYGPGGGRAAVCLTDNVPALTAHANDGGWETALAEAARPFLEHVPNCAVVAISSSGRSKNVCRVAELAKDIGHPIITFTGFEGEPLRSLGTLAIHVDSNDYEVVEPAHQALLHRVQFYIRTIGNVDQEKAG